MLSLALSLLLFSTAAIMNAIMDTLMFHFDQSIFSGKDRKFWDPSVSWNAAKYIPYTNYKIDAWHLAKSAMIILVALAAMVLLGNLKFIMPWWGYISMLIAYGIVWNVTFNAFFDVWLRKS